VAEITRDIVRVGLEKFRFKKFCPVSDNDGLDGLIDEWLESLNRNHVSPEEFMLAVLWLADNKPEWPDVADANNRIKKARKKRAETTPKIAIPVEGNVVSLVYEDSPAAQTFLHQKELERNEPKAIENHRPRFLEAADRVVGNQILEHELTDQERQQVEDQRRDVLLTQAMHLRQEISG
jgi:hypothetical protein